MSRLIKYRFLPASLAAGLFLHTNSAFACAACFGKSDSPLAQGMNWGIFSLLAMVVCVLGAIGSFAILLAKKASSVPLIMPSGELSPSNQKA